MGWMFFDISVYYYSINKVYLKINKNNKNNKNKIHLD